ncbi:MAG: AAA-like domain-containing protein [Anaerolineae bacterium]|nr:AAA-like domain-containing protein [Anaerolineae bacterium]
MSEKETHPANPGQPDEGNNEQQPSLKTLGKYKIISQLGMGGMARVFKAYQPGLDRHVAIKVIHSHLSSTGNFIERFEREAATIARLRHPGIVQVYDFDSQGGLYYMVMELIEGPSLKTRLEEHYARQQTFSLSETLHILTTLGGAIDAAHAQGIVHRDLKPANIMFTAEGQAVLTDFGIARIFGKTSFTSTGTIAGTPKYMSPEQVQGERGDERSDIYSLGVTLYEMLTGCVPFDADNTFGIMMKHVTEQVPPPTLCNPDIPQAVEQVILKALSKSPDDRYQTAGDLVNAFENAIKKPAATTKARVFISYKRHVTPDEPLAVRLRQALEQAGHIVFIDQKLEIGVNWAQELERQIKDCDFMIVLLSEASVDSEMIAKEVECAHRYHKQTGRSRLLPVRISYEGTLPYQISHYLDPLHYVEWHHDADNETLAEQILDAVSKLTPLPKTGSKPASDDESEAGITTAPQPYADPRFVESLRDPSGAVGRRSQFYIAREEDDQLLRELAKPYGTTTTIRAPRQSGKSSLLIRGIAQAKAQGNQVVFLDLQPIASSYLQSLDDFLYYFATSIVTKLKLDPGEVEKAWRSSLGAPDKTTYLMEGYVLPEADHKIVLAIDEADLLLRTPFHDNFFGLIRFWHNSRAMDDIWENLDIVMVISTEPHLLIGDVTQSPFNVGLKLRLQDFDQNQVRELNARYRQPLNEQRLSALYGFLGGHPYLTHKAIYIMVTENVSWQDLPGIAASESSPFGDHLRRYLWLLRDQPKLRNALKTIIATNQCPDEVSYYRLLQAGLIKGHGRSACTCRCELYELYLKDKL